MKEKKNWLGKVVLLIAVIAAVAVYFLVPGVNKMMNKVFAMFASGDFTVVRDFVASYGAYAAVISFLLMIFQSILVLSGQRRYHADRMDLYVHPDLLFK